MPEAWDMLRAQVLELLGEPSQATTLSAVVVQQLARALEHVRQPLLAGKVGSPYLETPALAAAYSAGLAPRTLAAALQHIPILPPTCHVLDLGAGTGAASLACLARGARRFTLVDHGGAALLHAQKTLRVGGAQEVNLRAVDLTSTPKLGRTFDVVVLGFSLLEAAGDDAVLAARLLAWAAQQVGPKGLLLLLDSAQKERARAVNQLRNTLLTAGLHLWGPCPHAQACPALVRPRDFCHATTAWDLPPDFASVGERAGLHRHRLTYSYLLAGQEARPCPGNAVVVGEVLKEKGRVRWALCSNTPAREVMVLQRNEDAYAAALALQRGDILALPPKLMTQPLVRVEDGACLVPR